MYEFLVEATTFSAEELEKMSWSDIVDNVILPQLAGLPEERSRIGGRFMVFMAKFAEDICKKAPVLGDILLEIGMQRISCGAVLHRTKLPIDEALPEKYRKYASESGRVGSEPGPMGPECYDFIINALPLCLKRDGTRAHALSIAFALVENLSPDGTPENGYRLGTYEFQPNGKLLFKQSCAWIERYAHWQAIYAYYATPTQWEKHIDWFAKQAKKDVLDWEDFFNHIGTNGKKNIFRRWRQKRAIKSKLLRFLV